MLPHPWARVKGPLGATQMQCNGDKVQFGLETTGRCLAAEPSVGHGPTQADARGGKSATLVDKGC
eukprot:4244212-Karenia_brevis.AAC.1